MLLAYPKKVALIGGGFSGIITAVNLARLSQRPLHLTIINCKRPTGRGVAYGTRRPDHLLNVVARNMSAFPDLPEHFLQWLRTRCDYDSIPDAELRERFIPRMIYGDYLRCLMQQHLQFPSSLATADFVQGEAVDMEIEGQEATIHLAEGGRVVVDQVILATGNEPPAPLPGSESLLEHPGWVGNPWQSWEDRLPAPGSTIVVLGTGLTTVDAIITLKSLGWQGLICAVSRNGWLPKSHFRGIDYPHFPPPGVDLAELGLVKLVQLMEEHGTKLRQLGANPAIVVDKMRPHTQRVWRRFSLAERREFARLHAPRWNVLRHRIAPEIHAQVVAAQEKGQLQIQAGAIERVEPLGNKIRVHLAGGSTLTGDLVINATGPQTKFSTGGSPFLRNLLEKGLISADAMDMGVQVDEDHTVIDGQGERSKVLLALGPLLRGTLWETIAVPELRVQARRVAETVLDAATPEPSPMPMMEYMI